MLYGRLYSIIKATQPTKEALKCWPCKCRKGTFDYDVTSSVKLGEIGAEEMLENFNAGRDGVSLSWEFHKSRSRVQHSF